MGWGVDSAGRLLPYFLSARSRVRPWTHTRAVYRNQVCLCLLDYPANRHSPDRPILRAVEPDAAEVQPADLPVGTFVATSLTHTTISAARSTKLGKMVWAQWAVVWLMSSTCWVGGRRGTGQQAAQSCQPLSSPLAWCNGPKEGWGNEPTGSFVPCLPVPFPEQAEDSAQVSPGNAEHRPWPGRRRRRKEPQCRLCQHHNRTAKDMELGLQRDSWL